MSKLKPYLFWIVAGGVILVELVIMILMMPDVDVVGDKKAAMDAKASLDKEYKHLKELDARAQRGVPADKYDAEKPDDIKKLTDDFLVTPAWKSILEAQVGQYDKMLSAIKVYLGNRSKSLRAPIAESTDKQVWYVTYEAVTAELLRQAHSEGRVVLTPSAVLSQRPVALTEREKSTEASKEIDYASDVKAREVLGLFTKGADFPETKDHPQLTGRLRSIELVLTSLRGAKIGTVANAVVPSEAAPSELAQIIALKFGADGSTTSRPGTGSIMPPGMMPPGMMAPGMIPPGATPSGAAPGNMPPPGSSRQGPEATATPVVAADDGSIELTGEIANHATGRLITLTLQGPLAALMGAQAALEHGNPEGPVIVVTSFLLQRKSSFAIGERKGVAAEPMTARIGILILDFTRALQTAAATETKAAAPAASIVPGMPAAPAGAPGLPTNKPN